MQLNIFDFCVVLLVKLMYNNIVSARGTAG